MLPRIIINVSLMEEADDLFNRQAFYEAVPLYEKVSMEEPFAPDPLPRFYSLIQAIKCYSYLKDTGKEFHCINRATVEINLVENIETRAKIAHVLGNATFEINMLPAAIEFFQVSISLYGKIGNLIERAAVLLDYQAVLELLADWQGVYDLLQVVGEDLRNISKRSPLLGKYLLNKGVVESFILGALEKGETIFEDLYWLLERADPYGYMGYCLGNIALLKLEIGDYFEALRLSGKVAWTARIKHNTSLFLLSQEIFILVLENQERFQEGRYVAEHVISQYASCNRFRILTAKMCGLCGETERAVELFYTAIAIAGERKALWEELAANIWLADLYVSVDNIVEGKKKIKEVIQILEVITERFKMPLRDEFLERNYYMKKVKKIAWSLNMKIPFMKETEKFSLEESNGQSYLF